jgi:hypothetical protein
MQLKNRLTYFYETWYTQILIKIEQQQQQQQQKQQQQKQRTFYIQTYMHFCAYLGCNFAKFSKYLLEGKTF